MWGSVGKYIEVGKWRTNTNTNTRYKDRTNSNLIFRVPTRVEVRNAYIVSSTINTGIFWQDIFRNNLFYWKYRKCSYVEPDVWFSPVLSETTKWPVQMDSAVFHRNQFILVAIKPFQNLNAVHSAQCVVYNSLSTVHHAMCTVHRALLEKYLSLIQTSMYYTQVGSHSLAERWVSQPITASNEWRLYYGALILGCKRY